MLDSSKALNYTGHQPILENIIACQILEIDGRKLIPIIMPNLACDFLFFEHAC